MATTSCIGATSRSSKWATATAGTPRGHCACGFSAKPWRSRANSSCRAASGVRHRIPARVAPVSEDSLVRCAWATTPLGIAYHDSEWGVPVHEDRLLFEFLILEGAQAGLSWETILRKRDAYRRAFDGFEPARVARFTPATVRRLMKDESIVRNRLKIESAVTNAKAFLAVQREFGSFDAYLWRFVGGRPIVNRRRRSA